MPSPSQQLSRSRLVILFVVSLVEMTFFSAVLLGWPSLLIILEEEGIGSHLCSRRETHIERNGSRSVDELRMCAEQEKSLNLGVNIAKIVQAVYMFIAGWAIDKYGAKAVKIFSSFMFSVSAGLLTFTSHEKPQILSAALVTLTIACTGLFLSIMKSATLYGKWKSTVTSVFGCALASSAVLFLIFKVLYDQGVSYQALCQGFIYLTLAILLSSIVIFPDFQDEDHRDPKPLKTKPQSEKKLDEKSFATLRDLFGHMRSGIFVATCLFIGICRLRLFFFMTTFQQFMMALPNMDKDSVRTYVDYYGISQLSGLAFGPLVGAVITAAVEMSRRSGAQRRDRELVTTLVATESESKSKVHVEIDAIAMDRACEVRGCTVYYVSSGFLLVLLSLLTVIPNVPLQIFSFIVVTLLRCLYNGGYSNLFLVVFPSKHFGKLYGTGCIVTSLIQMLQLPMFNIMESYFPNEILKFNVGFLLISIPLGVGYPCYLWYFAKRLEKEASWSTKFTPSDCNSAMERLLYERVTVV